MAGIELRSPSGAGRAAADRDRAGRGEHPAGVVEGTNDFGEEGYSGPRPPVGDDPHRYFFRVYATSAPLGLVAGHRPRTCVAP